MKSFPERKLHHERCENRIQLLKRVLHSRTIIFLSCSFYTLILVLIYVGIFFFDCNYFVKNSEHILCQILALVVKTVSF